MDKIKNLEMGVNNEKGAIKSNHASPKMVSVNKKVPLMGILTLLSIGKNIEYNFKSLENNPVIPKTTASNDFFRELEKYVKSMGIAAIGYTKVSPEVIFQDKAILYENAIVLTKEINKNSVNNEIQGKTPKDLKLYDELGKNKSNS